jgi:hypothetical protein
MSSNYRRNISQKAGAAQALDSSKGKTTYFHTKCGKDEWWSAQFGGKVQVEYVRIQNRF